MGGEFVLFEGFRKRRCQWQLVQTRVIDFRTGKSSWPYLLLEKMEVMDVCLLLVSFD